MMNYEVLANICKSRKNHKLDEWSENYIDMNGVDMSLGEGIFGFCDWIKTLLYSEMITGDTESKKENVDKNQPACYNRAKE